MQDHYGYLPKEALEQVCALTDIRPADVTGVASFYDMLRHAPVGKHVVRVCVGTACHVAGTDKIADALRLHLHIPPGEDTDADREFTIESVACLGCCTLAPVVKIDGATIGHATAEKVPEIIRDFLANQNRPATNESTEELSAVRANANRASATIHVGLGSCCMAKGSDELCHALRAGAARSGAQVNVKRVGCVGMCHRTPMIEVALPGGGGASTPTLTPDHASASSGGTSSRAGCGRATQLWQRALDGLLIDVAPPGEQVAQAEMTMRDEGVHVSRASGAYRHRGIWSSGSARPDEYIAHGASRALKRVLGGSVAGRGVIATVEGSVCADAAGPDFRRGKNGGSCTASPARRNLSSATATKATPARSWTA